MTAIAKADAKSDASPAEVAKATAQEVSSNVTSTEPAPNTSVAKRTTTKRKAAPRKKVAPKKKAASSAKAAQPAQTAKPQAAKAETPKPEPQTSPKPADNPKRTSTMADQKNPTETMKTQAETAMNQSKAAFEDMASKSKGMMEKNVKTMEEMGSLARGNVEAMVEAGRIYAEGSQEIAREAADFAKKQAEETAATVQAMSSVKNPNEVVELQGKYVRGQFDAMVQQSSAMTERMLKLSSDVMAPFQNRMATSMSKFTTGV